ncbi:ClpXP protease specificity-enhancing factor [Chromohalobacter canadensis]|uniref:ClpXP protease specificity-enhancing factor n=1 Tax=Chromohalobacter canadensis TaxID=141389 RepID=A0ABZ0YC60_9GAMM|nr:ClpXP protease specificity-enhancing factor [Chromohalobacter canadensis]MCK0769154.1 ClpXP protease specificity-enhancing factor [Chromohalobacter canadensis]WQH09443.1 ClpXP protease specificity-enhancing factor [Chromohalobacter canadensis]
MLSSRPYLARALYEWLLDNGHTPYIVVDAEREGVNVPRQSVQNGQIVLNIAPSAVRDLYIENAAVTFGARFSGQPMEVVVPMEALIALYARENGVGMVFGHEPVMPEAETSEGNGTQPKDDDDRPALESVEAQDDEEASGTESDSDDARRTKGRPSLRVVK